MYFCIFVQRGSSSGSRLTGLALNVYTLRLPRLTVTSLHTPSGGRSSLFFPAGCVFCGKRVLHERTHPHARMRGDVESTRLDSSSSRIVLSACQPLPRTRALSCTYHAPTHVDTHRRMKSAHTQMQLETLPHPPRAAANRQRNELSQKEPRQV